MQDNKVGFYAAIEKFNAIYRLEAPGSPTLLPVDRIRNFQDILAEEVEEGAEIAAKFEAFQKSRDGSLTRDQRLEVLGDVADWLGDIVVYCASEARRWGLPLHKILEIIMESNFSKLDADGNPIYDERGKVMKGPGYWKPEPQIRAALADILHD